VRIGSPSSNRGSRARDNSRRIVLAVAAILTLAALITWIRFRHRPALDESQDPDPGLRCVPVDVPAPHQN